MPQIDRRFFATALLCLSALIVSCHRRPSQPVVPPPVTSSPALLSYEAGEKSFEAGNYTAAVKGYEAYLRTNAPENQDRTHFRLGLSYSLAPENAENLRLARVYFQRLAAQFPKSQYRAPADLILLLLTEIDKLNGNIKEQQSRIKTLTEELQRLKAIDMKRSPSRPPR